MARARIANETFEPANHVWHRRGNAATDSIRRLTGVAVISRNNISPGAIVITPGIPTRRAAARCVAVCLGPQLELFASVSRP